jgi:hypothetical protein
MIIEERHPEYEDLELDWDEETGEAKSEHISVNSPVERARTMRAEVKWVLSKDGKVIRPVVELVRR